MIFNYNGLKINYEIFGEGKPLLLLHGWMGCIESMAPIYQNLKDKHKIYVLDFPGQGGKSDTLSTPWGVFEYAKMVETFMKEFNLTCIDVIAHSFGGRVVIEIASKDKNAFDKIVLTDAAGVKPKSSLKKRMKILSYKFSRRLLKIITPKEEYEQKLNELRKKYGSTDYGMLTTDSMRETFKRVVNYDQTSKLKYIENSTLLMWGENDLDTPVYMGKIMNKKIKDSGLIILENAGHFSYLDNSTKYLNIVNNFLGGKNND